MCFSVGHSADTETEDQRNGGTNRHQTEERDVRAGVRENKGGNPLKYEINLLRHPKVEIRKMDEFCETLRKRRAAAQPAEAGKQRRLSVGEEGKTGRSEEEGRPGRGEGGEEKMGRVETDIRIINYLAGSQQDSHAPPPPVLRPSEPEHARAPSTELFGNKESRISQLQ